MQRKSSEPKKHSTNQRMSFDTVNIPRHLNAFMIMKNRRNALDYSDTNDDVADDFERQNRHRNPFGYRLKAMEPFYFQYKPMAENQFQGGDKSVIRPLTDFSSDYDFENGDEYNDFFDTDDVVDAVQGPGDSVGQY